VQLTFEQSGVLPVDQTPAIRARRRHIDLNLVSFLVAAYDLLILLAAGSLAFALIPTLAAAPYRMTAAALALAICCGWGWLRSFWRYSIDRFVAQSLATRLAMVIAGAALVFGVPALLEWAVAGPKDPLLRWLEVWCAMALGGAIGLRVALDFVMRAWRAEGSLKQTVAIVGGGDLAARLVQWLETTCADTIEIVGLFDDRQRPGAPRLLPSTFGGTTDDLIELAQRETIDRIIVALPHAAEQRLMWILRKLKQIPVDICLAPDQVGFAAAVARPGDYSGLPVVKVYGRPLEAGQRLIKGLIDRAVAALVLIVLAPLMLLVGLIIRLGGGPVLVSEQRLGVGNRVIRLTQFRTRRPDDPNGAFTGLGRFLERGGIAQLPQFFNVLLGEVSLVGPRPMPLHMAVENKLSHDVVAEYAWRHRVKPGLTGWAQIHCHGRELVDIEVLHDAVELDLDYIDHWSLGLDARILAATISGWFSLRSPL
jgi:putative colanic acid biosynthesis UDP-glucose lipid carrier transferase